MKNEDLVNVDLGYIVKQPTRESLAYALLSDDTKTAKEKFKLILELCNPPTEESDNLIMMAIISESDDAHEFVTSLCSIDLRESKYLQHFFSGVLRGVIALQPLFSSNDLEMVAGQFVARCITGSSNGEGELNEGWKEDVANLISRYTAPVTYQARRNRALFALFEDISFWVQSSTDGNLTEVKEWSKFGQEIWVNIVLNLSPRIEPAILLPALVGVVR